MPKRFFISKTYSSQKNRKNWNFFDDFLSHFWKRGDFYGAEWAKNKKNPARIAQGRYNRKKLWIFCCCRLPKRKHGRWLRQSYLMAHAPICLVLLYPYPDTVRRDALHKTLLSTFLTVCGLPQPAPRKAFSPAIADCRYRAPLTPHLSQQILL